MCSLHFYRLNVKFFIVKTRTAMCKWTQSLCILLHRMYKKFTFHLGAIFRHFNLAAKINRVYQKVKNTTQSMLNYKKMLSETPICPDLNVIQEFNKIILKVWSNAIPTGNFYSCFQVLKATSRTCSDFVRI